MPSLAARFATDVDQAVRIARAGEIAWSAASPGSTTRRELTSSRINLLYEMAYLRLFVSWENFLEDAFLRMMCGWTSSLHTPVLAPPHHPFGTIGSARVALYGQRDYLLWHNAETVIRRCHRWFTAGVHSQVLTSNEARLEWFAAIRHRIAHGSEQVRREMNSASTGLAGRRYPGASAGRFLRDWNEADP